MVKTIVSQTKCRDVDIMDVGSRHDDVLLLDAVNPRRQPPIPLVLSLLRLQHAAADKSQSLCLEGDKLCYCVVE